MVACAEDEVASGYRQDGDAEQDHDAAGEGAAKNAFTRATDGIERMVLDMATQTPFARFFSTMAAPLPKEPGKAHILTPPPRAPLPAGI